MCKLILTLRNTRFYCIIIEDKIIKDDKGHNYFTLERFEEDSANAGPAELYFEDPFDLIRIFRAMETQNLSALIHLESLAAPMADMAVTINVIETRIKTEIMEITSTIDDLQVRTKYITMPIPL